MSLCFFRFSIEASKCSGSYNNINQPYAKICVPDVVKNLNAKVFNVMSRTNETRFLEWHETYECECKFGANICNNKQRWNKNKCRCECKELIHKGVCGKGFIWNPSNCECEYIKRVMLVNIWTMKIANAEKNQLTSWLMSALKLLKK